MKTKLNTSYLVFAGLVMIVVGAYISITPFDYWVSLNGERAMAGGAGLHQTETLSLNMLSDLRGMGGMLLVFGIYSLISVFRPSMRQSALLISSLIYGTFFIFRTLGFVLDGLPDVAVRMAYGVELALAAIGLTLLITKAH